MRKITRLKVLVTAVAMLLITSTQAQVRILDTIYCAADITLEKDNPAVVSSLVYNGICGLDGGVNSYLETWISYDLSNIILNAGEEIIDVAAYFRIGGNNGQGYDAIVLADKYDTWSETTLSWSEAIALGDFDTEGGDTIFSERSKE